MDEKDLLIFLTLAETGNLTRTAEKLYLAQPTLSKRLQNMEAELGAQLFLRSKHGVALTPAGEAARETIQKTVDDFEALREHIQQSKGGVGGTLRVEASIDYSNYRLPKILADYTARYPNVNLKVSTAETACVNCRRGRPILRSCGASTTGTRARSCWSGSPSVSSAAGPTPIRRWIRCATSAATPTPST